MLRRTFAAAAAAMLLAACSDGGPTGPAGPDPRALKPSLDADHTVPPTLNTPDCRGQAAAFVAQFAKTSGVPANLGGRGIGGLARLLETSVTDQQQFIEEFCASLPSPPED